MAYLFDDASSQSLTRTGTTTLLYAISLWFYPDDSGVDCALYTEANALGSAFLSLQFNGLTGGDKVQMQSSGLPGPIVTSTGTANINAWNHVYWGRGVADATKNYISLNGETLVSGTWAAPAGLTARRIGRVGLGQYMSGRIERIGIWDNNLHDTDDRYKALSLGFPPTAIAQDPNDTSGLGAINLTSYIPLIGPLHDVVLGGSWTNSGGATIADGPRMHRSFMD